nr:immunoglobulin heavy chain junction region [Macaca mulatta]MOW46477.1 immunoglobulin heavy chain junction region [Macaca mulatta]MOW46684.1 immunoglobulin heavy chain junction region [Macaca mulatta]MOW46914.1 immunoglobulin heavy chain junction region [Macaca mulatta]MOW47065.1 immunoglobulin heavy chain junction region [Macaca mulatta]
CARERHYCTDSGCYSNRFDVW